MVGSLRKADHKMSERLQNTLQSFETPVDTSTTSSEAWLAAENERLCAEVIKLQLQLFDTQLAADMDALIPIYNRRAFMRELSRASAMVKHHNIQSSMIFFDLNGFQSINDQFGSIVGDELLQKVGSVLLDGVRECDLIARLRGDEFGALLFKTDIEAAKAKAAVLACRISEEMIELPTGDVQVTAAWGVASCDSGDDADDILARADHAMCVARGTKV